MQLLKKTEESTALKNISRIFQRIFHFRILDTKSHQKAVQILENMRSTKKKLNKDTIKKVNSMKKRKTTQNKQLQSPAIKRGLPMKSGTFEDIQTRALPLQFT